MPNWRETANRGFTTYPGVGAHDHQGNTTSNSTYACSWYAPGNFYSEPEQAGWLPDSFFPGHTEEMRATLAVYDHESYAAGGLVDYLSLSPPFVASGDGLVTRGPASWREPQWLDIEQLIAVTTLAADPGAYVLTGTAAGTLYNRLMTADSGAYVLTGSAATLFKSFIMAAGSGSYTLSGSAVSTLYNRLLAAGSGSYVLTGTAATTSKAFILVAGSGVYILTGSSVTTIAPAVEAAGEYIVTWCRHRARR